MEGVNKEVKRQINVVGVFPGEASVVRRLGAVLLEIANEWQMGRRYFRLESTAKLTESELLLVAEPAPFHLVPFH